MRTTLTYRILNKLSLLNNEKVYGSITLWGVTKKCVKTFRNLLLYKYSYSSFLLEPLNFKKLRAKCWRVIGCNVGDNVYIGHSVTMDYGNANLINIGNGVSITDNCILLCHRKDISGYKRGDNSLNLPFIQLGITLEDGVNLGKGAIVLPGVTIGRGSVIGAGSVVTKNIPSWCIAVGSPAKVIKKLEEK